MAKKTEIDYTKFRAYALAERYYRYESRRVKTSRAIIRAALEFRRNYRVEAEHKPKARWADWGRQESQVIAVPRSGTPGAQKTLYTTTLTFEPRAKQFNDEEREYRRTRHDPKFRKSLLCRLQRELKALNKAPEMTLDAITAWADDATKREQTYKAIAERIRRISARSKIPNLLTYADLPNVGYLYTNVRTARKCGGKLDMRGADARILLTYKKSWLDYREGWTEWSGGRPISYTRATRDNYVRSFGIIKLDGLLQAVCAERTFEQTAPEGFRWILENERIALQRDADEQIRRITAVQLLKPESLTIDFPALPEPMQQAS